MLDISTFRAVVNNAPLVLMDLYIIYVAQPMLNILLQNLFEDIN